MVSRRNRPTELVDMGKLISSSGGDPLMLVQVRGSTPSRKIRVLPMEEMVLGRDDDCEVVLDEEPVSRRHAKVAYYDRQPELFDLGSTNGTFLNGKRVQRAFLKEGDRIQVGAHTFEIRIGVTRADVPGDEASEIRTRDLQSRIQKKRDDPSSSPQQATAIFGRISEIRLTSLLQILDSDRATGTLVVLYGGIEGKIHIHHGAVRHATLGRARGVKALYRMMALEEGTFELYIPGRSAAYATIEGDLQKHLLEGMRQKDEVELYRRQLPSASSLLRFAPEKALPLSRVPAPVFDVMASVSRYGTVGEVIELCNLPDVEVCRVLLALLKHGIVTVGSETTN